MIYVRIYPPANSSYDLRRRKCRLANRKLMGATNPKDAEEGYNKEKYMEYQQIKIQCMGQIQRRKRETRDRIFF